MVLLRQVEVVERLHLRGHEALRGRRKDSVTQGSGVTMNLAIGFLYGSTKHHVLRGVRSSMRLLQRSAALRRCISRRVGGQTLKGMLQIEPMSTARTRGRRP
jgi:hypothetical protein